MSHEPGTIRITFPAALALSPEGFTGALTSIAEKLGCGKCFSGVDCLLQRQKDYIVNEKSVALPQDPIPVREFSTVGVAMTAATFSDIEQLRNAAALVFKNLGCLPCTSGFDVLFRNTIRTLTLDEKLNVKQFGKGF